MNHFQLHLICKQGNVLQEHLIDLSSQVALVTDGSRGIGAATAKTLAKAGADIVIFYRNDINSARNVKKEIRTFGRKCMLLKGRIEDYHNCKENAAVTLKTFK